MLWTSKDKTALAFSTLVSFALVLLMTLGCGQEQKDDEGEGSDSSEESGQVVGSGGGGSASLTCSSSSEPFSVSAQAPTAGKSCVSIAVMQFAPNGEELATQASALEPPFTTHIGNGLPRASVRGMSELISAIKYTEFQQLLGIDVNDPDSYQDMIESFGKAYTSSEIVIAGSYHVLNGVHHVFASAIDVENVQVISRAHQTVGSANDLSGALKALADELVVDLKAVKHCLSITPTDVVIDFQNPEKRTQVFSVEVKNLADEPAEDGVEVSFAIEQPTAGTLSAEKAKTAQGKASVTFTMTTELPNALTATVVGPTGLTTEANAMITPLCGLVLEITGTRTIDLDKKNFGFFELTAKGTGTMSAYVSLDETETEGESVVTGYGRFSTDVDVPQITLVTGLDIMGESVPCTVEGSTKGTVEGDMRIFGVLKGEAYESMIMGFGSSTSGGASASGGCGDLTSSSSGMFVSSEWLQANVVAEDGWSTTVTGDDGFSSYEYLLEVKRAEQ